MERPFEGIYPALCAAALLACAAIPVAASAKGLEIEDMRQMVGVDSPVLSPDGTRIAYVRSTVDWKGDRRNTELVLIDVRSDTVRALTQDRIGVSDPQWSRDGSAIAYLASPERGKPPQIFVLPMNGGDSKRVTNAPSGVDGYAWRPDGRQFAYATADEAPEKKTPAEKALDAIVITDNDYLTREAPMPDHLWIVASDGGEAKRLNSGDWSVEPGDPVWSPDGNKIYYNRQPDAIFAHFVSQTTFVHDVVAGTDTDLGYGINGGIALSRDGTMAAIATPRHGSLYLQVDATVRATSNGRQLFDSRSIDRNVHDVHWFGQDSGLLYEAADGVRDAAWMLDSNGHARKLDLGDVDPSQADTSIDGGIAFVGMRRDAFAEIYYLAPGTTTPKRMTSENAWAQSYEFGKSEAFEWQTDMGVKAVGVLTYPVGYVAGKKYPLALLIHGGPVSTSTWDMQAGSPQSRQVLAKRGYLVFQPNYRGSDNLGDAFLQAIVGDVASGPGRDNIAAVRALIATGMVDESHVYVSGWSGGGLQTGWLIGHASLWRAAVAGAGVYDWYEQAVLSDINENFAQVFFNGTTPFSEQGRAAYAAESPLSFVDAVRTPTLILSDTRDQRVPVSQSYIFYHALKQRGVPVTFTAFPRGGHYPTDPVGEEIVMRAWLGWFDKWR